MLGDSGIPEALIDVVREEVKVDGAALTLIRPRDWDELRHQEGAEGRSAHYWAVAWSSGLALGDLLGVRELAGKRVLELGCGLGVPSLVAARRGASVLATDAEPDALVFAAHNLALNDLEGEVALVDWRDAGALTERGPWDLVLAADVLYLRHNVEALMRLMPALLAGGGEALIADPSRAGGRDVLAAARRMFEVEARRETTRESVAIYAGRGRRAA